MRWNKQLIIVFGVHVITTQKGVLCSNLSNRENLLFELLFTFLRGVCVCRTYASVPALLCCCL